MPQAIRRSVPWLPVLQAFIIVCGLTLAFLSAAGAPVWWIVLAIAAVLVSGYLFVHPRAVVVLLIMAWAGPFDSVLLTRRIGGLEISVGVVLLLIGLGWVVASRLTRRGPRPPLGGFAFRGPAILLTLAILYSLVEAYIGGDSRGMVINTGLMCFAWLVYFVARDAYADDPEALARHMVLTTGLAAGIVALGVITGQDILYGRQIGYVITDGAAADTVRIDPPLLRLLSITILMVGPGRILARGPFRRWRWPIIVLMLLAQVLSFTRSTWLPLILAAILISGVAARNRSILVLVRNVTIATILLMCGLTVAASGAAGEQGRLVADRFLSVTETSVLTDDSYQDRARENEQALARISENPLRGLGMARPYGAYVSMRDPINEDWELYDQRRFIHESYLGVWMWMGVPGLVALLSAFVVTIKIGARVLMERTHSRQAPIAALAGLGALAISSTFQTNIMYPPAHLALGLGIAYVETWLRNAEHVPTVSAAALADTPKPEYGKPGSGRSVPTQSAPPGDS